jgi:hypothetical protein
VLEGTVPRIPAAGLGCIAAFLLPFVVTSAWYLGASLFRGLSSDPLNLAITAFTTLFWAAVVTSLVRVVRRRAWMPSQLRADRDAGIVELLERSVLTGRERREAVPLAELAGLSLETVTRRRIDARTRDLAGEAFDPNVRIRLRIDVGSRKPRVRVLELHVEGVDRREEVADLAYRLGAACGLSYQRVVRSDPRDIELDVTPSMGPGHERIPRLEGAANYAADVFSKAAVTAAADERVPPFDPAGFPSDHTVAKWLPGRQVQLRKPLGFAAVGCLPFAIAGLLLGPGLYVLSASRRPEVAAFERFVPSLGVGMFGLFVGLIALLAVAAALPRRLTIDWARQSISIGGLFSRTEIPLPDVAAIEAKCVRPHHSGGKNSSSYHSYRCEVLVHRRDPASAGKPVVLLQTREFREDPDTPYRRTIPLVTELAEALGVERRVTDYS